MPATRSARKPVAKPAKGSGDYAAQVQRDRELKDRFMATQPESPFSEANLPFHGLKYYAVDPAWRLSATFEETVGAKEVLLRTSEDGHASMRQIGTLTFERGGKKHALQLFHAGPQAGNIAFLPFRDRTSGKETYGPGRYLNLELQEGKDYLLDFNTAFNPYCAYTPGYECPFPPVENGLPLAVEAGEKVYDPENNPASPEEAIRLLTIKFREKLAARKAAAAASHPSHPAGG
jgi:uncharacterized protein